jgi:hypothetical protein
LSCTTTAKASHTDSIDNNSKWNDCELTSFDERFHCTIFSFLSFDVFK